MPKSRVLEIYFRRFLKKLDFIYRFVIIIELLPNMASGIDINRSSCGMIH